MDFEDFPYHLLYLIKDHDAIEDTLFPRIMVHALKYETEAITIAPNESPI